jgi:hypothetical protein
MEEIKAARYDVIKWAVKKAILYVFNIFGVSE